MPSFFFLTLFLCGVILPISLAIDDKKDDNTEKAKITSISIKKPAKCPIKAKIGNEVSMQFVLKLENKHGKKLASSLDANQLLVFQIGGNEVITGTLKKIGYILLCL